MSIFRYSKFYQNFRSVLESEASIEREEEGEIKKTALTLDTSRIAEKERERVRKRE